MIIKEPTLINAVVFNQTTINKGVLEAADGLGLTPTYSGGPVLASDGNYYMPLDVTFSFPNSFDFNTVRCESNNWLAIRLKVRDVTGWDGVSFPPPNFETYYIQINNL